MAVASDQGSTGVKSDTFNDTAANGKYVRSLYQYGVEIPGHGASTQHNVDF
jgi:hypothetical protein